jgi:nucleotide-binding universal stress UspA family protein
VQQALALAAREEATVLLLHVLPSLVPGSEKTLRANVEHRLQALARGATVPVHTRIVWGTPGAELCRVATEHYCDLIAMRTHGRTGLSLVHLGSVADHVIRHAPCTVLILRPSHTSVAREETEHQETCGGSA